MNQGTLTMGIISGMVALAARAGMPGASGAMIVDILSGVKERRRRGKRKELLHLQDVVSWHNRQGLTDIFWDRKLKVFRRP